MKVLYINYIYQKGHINFDHIHIDALITQVKEVKLIMHKDIATQLPYPKEMYAMIIPSCFNPDSSNGVINRFFYLLILLYIRALTTFKHYDKVILSSMDEISLGLLPLCNNMNIICHDNARHIDERIKGFFIKRLSHISTFIVFNNEMSRPFKEKGMRSYIVSHGCINSFIVSENISLPINITSYHRVVFHPSARPNEYFVSELKRDKSLQQFLHSNNILLILRTLKPRENISSNIIFLNEYLTDLQYKALFLSSDIILLAYPDDFNYRVSGVSFECVANAKRLLIRENQSLKYCCNYYNYNPMFNNVLQLVERIRYLGNHKEARCIVKPEDIKPNYTEIISS